MERVLRHEERCFNGWVSPTTPCMPACCLVWMDIVCVCVGQDSRLHCPTVFFFFCSLSLQIVESALA